MKNSKKIYVVNNQEDEDLESYILYPENAITTSKQTRVLQPAADSIERIKQTMAASPPKKNDNVLTNAYK